MLNQSMLHRTYSIFFVAFALLLLFSQLFVPGMTLETISEDYLWKKNLIKTYRGFKYQIGDRVFPYSIVGEGGWLYFTGDMSIQEYQRSAPLRMGKIKELTQMMSKIKDQTAKYGGMFLLVIVPDKSTVYPQYMPVEIPVIGQISSVDRLIEYVEKNSNVQVVDLRPVLSSVSKDAQIYYKTDTHWNCLGAFYASNEILFRVSNVHPEIHPYSLDEFQFSSEEQTLDIPLMMGLDIKEEGLTNVKPEFETNLLSVSVEDKNYKNQSLRIRVNAQKDLPDLMIFHDSFYSCMSVFLEPAFSKTISMHFNEGELNDYLEMITTEKPDVVIMEFVQRNIDYFYGHLSR